MSGQPRKRRTKNDVDVRELLRIIADQVFDCEKLSADVVEISKCQQLV